VFQVEDLLEAAVATLMAGDPGAVVPELNGGGVDPRFDDRARLQRHRVGVGPHLRAARLVDAWEADLGQVEGLRNQGQRVFLLVQQPGSGCIGTPGYHPALVPLNATAPLQTNKYFTVGEIAEILALSDDSVLKQFAGLDGVIDVGTAGGMHRRRKRLLRIPPRTLELYLADKQVKVRRR